MTDPLQELLFRAKQGDRDALADLLEHAGSQVAGRLHGSIGRQWQSVLSVDDVMQVSFLEAFLEFDRHEGTDVDSLVAWLTRIATNNLQDAIRGLQRDKRPPPSKRVQQLAPEDTYLTLVEQMGADTTTITSKAARSEAKRLLESSLQKLPRDYATVLRLYDLEGLSGHEVGEQLQRSRGAVHMLRSRALQHLRELLGAESNFFSFTGESD